MRTVQRLSSTERPQQMATVKLETLNAACVEASCVTCLAYLSEMGGSYLICLQGIPGRCFKQRPGGQGAKLSLYRYLRL